MSSLESEFERRMRESIRQCVSLGYTPSRFTEMLNTLGALRTAKQLVVSGEIQEGLRRLVSMNRPDLAMESIMLEPEFESLFRAPELSAARWRLDQAFEEAS